MFNVKSIIIKATLSPILAIREQPEWHRGCPCSSPQNISSTWKNTKWTLFRRGECSPYRNLVEASVQCMLNILCFKEGYHRFQPQVFPLGWWVFTFGTLRALPKPDKHLFPSVMIVQLWDPEGTTKAKQTPCGNRMFHFTVVNTLHWNINRELLNSIMHFFPGWGSL